MGIAQKHSCINARIWWPTFFSPDLLFLMFRDGCYGGFWPRKVLLTFAFVAKPYALLWATVLFMHCSCMLIDLFGYLAILFVVGSLPCSERFFSGHSGFPLSSKTNISKFQFDQESGRRRTTMWMCYLQIVIYFIYLFIYLFN